MLTGKEVKLCEAEAEIRKTGGEGGRRTERESRRESIKSNRNQRNTGVSCQGCGWGLLSK